MSGRSAKSGTGVGLFVLSDCLVVAVYLLSFCIYSTLLTNCTQLTLLSIIIVMLHLHACVFENANVVKFCCNISVTLIYRDCAFSMENSTSPEVN